MFSKRKLSVIYENVSPAKEQEAKIPVIPVSAINNVKLPGVVYFYFFNRSFYRPFEGTLYFAEIAAMEAIAEKHPDNAENFSFCFQDQVVGYSEDLKGNKGVAIKTRLR